MMMVVVGGGGMLMVPTENDVYHGDDILGDLWRADAGQEVSLLLTFLDSGAS